MTEESIGFRCEMSEETYENGAGFICIIFGSPAYIDESIPKGKVIIKNTNGEFLGEISNIKCGEDGITYTLKPKKPLEYVSLDVLSDKE